MADSVVRLRVESAEYDSKLKRAAESLSRFFDTARQGGGTLSNLDGSVLQTVRAFGNMETKATTATGRLREMQNAYTELALRYKQMSEQERQSPIGQGMARSLDELRGRISEHKKQLDEVRQSMGGVRDSGGQTGGMLDTLSGQLGLNVGKLASWAGALAVGKSVLETVKDALFTSESTVDEWGRTVEAGETVWDGFLYALNNGDFSSFFENIGNLVSAAEEAYDALDNLHTMMSVFSAYRSTQNARLTELKATIRREGADSAAGKAAQAEMREVEKSLMGTYKMEEEYADKAYREQVDKRLAMGGVTLSDADKDKLIGVLTNPYEVNRYREMFKGKLNVNLAGAANWVKANTDMTDTRNFYAKLGDLFSDAWLEENNKLAEQAGNARNSAASLLLGDARYLRTSTGSGHGGRGGHGGTTAPPPPAAGSIAEQEAKVQSLQKAYKMAADDDARKSIKAQIEEANDALDRMNGKVKAPEGSMAALSEQLAALQKEQQQATTTEQWGNYQKAIDGVKKSMAALRGETEQMAEGLSGVTEASLGAWVRAQQDSMARMQIGGEDYQATYGNIIDTNTLKNVLSTAIASDITISPDTVEELWDKILGGENIPDSVWTDLQETINDQLQEMGVEPITIDVKTGNVTKAAKETTASWQDAARAVQSVGSALQSIEDPGAKIAGLIGQAIANIALGFATATAADSKMGVFGWISAIAGGLATMVSTISAIHSATGYAEGGVVGGHSYSGDNIIARVNSGEIILDRAQQDNIASQLTSSDTIPTAQPHVTGEMIYLGLNAYLRRSGMGELMTSRQR